MSFFHFLSIFFTDLDTPLGTIQQNRSFVNKHSILSYHRKLYRCAYVQIYIFSHLNICFQFYLSLLLIGEVVERILHDFILPSNQGVRKSSPIFHYPVMLYNILHCFFICQLLCLTDRKQNFCATHISIPKPGTVPST